MTAHERSRSRPGPRPVQVLAVTSGKGGVGKTNVSVNLACALADLGQSVLLLDADLGLANVDVLLDLHPRYHLGHVLAGEVDLEAVILQGPRGVRVVPAASGVRRLAALSDAEYAGIIQAFSALDMPLDTLVVDTPAGISDNVAHFCHAAQEVLVVVCDEPTSITDAYALVKVLSRDHGIRRFHILVNQAASVADGREVYRKLNTVCARFLDVALDLAGVVPHDDYLRRAVQRQRPVVAAYPRSAAAGAFRRLAREVRGWPVRGEGAGHIAFFFERLIQQQTPAMAEASL